MSVITTIIKPQSFEIVRDRIGRILADELLNQYGLSGNVNLKVSNWVERFINFDGAELPAVNVSLSEGNYDWNTALQSTGVYKYNIDCYVNAKSDFGVRGDVLAMTNLQQLLGACRSILMDSRYLTLGFATPPGFIGRRVIESLNIRVPDQKKDDSESTAMGRLVLSVMVPETTDYVVPALGAGFNTTVMLNSTARGYRWLAQGTYDIFDYSVDK